nr:1,4-alpha-glucan branching enzyme [Chloroflexaceae bacterium]
MTDTKTPKRTKKATPETAAPVLPVEVPPPAPPQPAITRFTNDDIYLFNEGSHFHLYEKMGAHPMTVDGVEGTYFAVWAPDANYVSVIGDFNYWDRGAHRLNMRGGSGIWEGFFPGISKGTLYKYHVGSRFNGYTVDKADPFASLYEVPPKTASVVWDREYAWNDGQWMHEREGRQRLTAPISIYEVHFGSWMRIPEEGNRSLTYREMAPRLADYVE